jgi:hypothetical protein
MTQIRLLEPINHSEPLDLTLGFASIVLYIYFKLSNRDHPLRQVAPRNPRR